MYVFSSNTAFVSGTVYAKFNAYALLRGYSVAEAAQKLEEEGYGA